MNLDMRQAIQLCTQRELDLITASRAKNLGDLPAGTLRSHIARARGLRNKFRDLAARQAREAREKSSPRRKRPSTTNRRTVQKAKLFDEVLKRFEAAAAEPATVRSARPTSRSSAARLVEARETAPLGAKSRALDSTRNRAQMGRSQAIRLHAHVGSRNRRSQARRDAR